MNESAAVETGTFSEQMKAGCWDLHQAAETGVFAKRLVKGEVSRDAYAFFVGQCYVLMKRLDEAIEAERGGVEALRIVGEEQMQGPRLAADLEALGVDVDEIEPIAETSEAVAMVERAEREDPLRLLGLHYVREGANNGNRFIAMKLGGALGLEDGRGLTHLDPYGERQREAWEAFKAGWDGLGLDAGERARVLEAGRDMFRAITAMHTGVSRECHVG